MLSQVRSKAYAQSVFPHLEDSLSLRRVRSKIQVHSAWLRHLFHRHQRRTFVVRALPSADHSGVRCDRLDSAHLLAWHLAFTYAHAGKIATRVMSTRRPNFCRSQRAGCVLLPSGYCRRRVAERQR